MITSEINTAEVVRKLDNMPERVRRELVPSIGRVALKLRIKVQKDKLDGQVLKVKSGRLRRSIADIVEQSGDKVSGVVSTPVKYAPPHEYGFNGTVSVREHLRTIKQAFGRPIDEKQITVSAHSMKMNLPERSFLRSALRELEASGAIMEEVNAALARAAA